MENFLDRHVEQPGDTKGKRQGGIMLAGLNGVDGLTRHIQPPCQIRLAPVVHRTQNFKTVFHSYSPFSLNQPSARLNTAAIIASARLPVIVINGPNSSNEASSTSPAAPSATRAARSI